MREQITNFLNPLKKKKKKKKNQLRNQLHLLGLLKKKKKLHLLGIFFFPLPFVHLFPFPMLYSLKLQIDNIPSISSSFFHPISNGHYFLSHSLFHNLNSSQWLSVFLSKFVNFWTKFIFYFLSYIYCERVTL